MLKKSLDNSFSCFVRDGYCNWIICEKHMQIHTYVLYLELGQKGPIRLKAFKSNDSGVPSRVPDCTGVLRTVVVMGYKAGMILTCQDVSLGSNCDGRSVTYQSGCGYSMSGS